MYIPLTKLISQFVPVHMASMQCVTISAISIILIAIHCVKIVQIRIAFWSVCFRIWTEYGKYEPEKIPYLDAFYVEIGLTAANYVNYTHGTKLQFTRLTNNLATILQKSALKENKPCLYFSMKIRRH